MFIVPTIALAVCFLLGVTAKFTIAAAAASFFIEGIVILIAGCYGQIKAIELSLIPFIMSFALFFAACVS